MKLKTASLLAIIGVSIALTGNIVSVVRNMTGPGQVPPSYLLVIAPSVVFLVSLLIFFVTLYRKQ